MQQADVEEKQRHVAMFKGYGESSVISVDDNKGGNGGSNSGFCSFLQRA